LLELPGEIHLAIEPVLLDVVEIARPRVNREAREQVFVRACALEEAERLFERLPRLPAVAEHHVIADLDAVALRELGRLDDLLGRDLLVDRLQNSGRSALHTEAEPRAAGQAHLAQELVGEQIDARVAAPEEAQVPGADLAAELDDALLVGRE